jgi:hypothetical protein
MEEGVHNFGSDASYKAKLRMWRDFNTEIDIPELGCEDVY